MYALTASSVCMGRAPSWGRRRRNPNSATKTKAAQRIHFGGKPGISIASDLSFLSRTASDSSGDGSVLIGLRHRTGARGRQRNLRAALDGRLAPHFHFNVVVQFVGRVSVAVEADITPLHTLGVDQLALIRFDVIQIPARAKAKLVVKVIVEDGRHDRPERGIVGDLHYNIAIHTRLRMEVPDENGVDIRTLRQVDLCPLLTGPKLDPRAFVAVLVSIEIGR